jgi:hypothetical protein
MTLRATFGIDPGITGAIMTLIDGQPGPFIDMPTVGTDGDEEVDGKAITDFISRVRSEHPGAVFSAAVERVSAAPVEGRRQGTTPMFKFGASSMAPKTVLRVLCVPFERPTPQSWRGRFGLTGQSKDAARTLAIHRVPRAAPDLRRKKDCNRADALWIALWRDQRAAIGVRAA